MNMNIKQKMNRNTKKVKKKVMKKVKVSGSSAVSSTRQWVYTCRNITAEAKLILDDVSDDLSDDVEAKK